MTIRNTLNLFVLLSVDDAQVTWNPFSNSILCLHDILNLIIWMPVYEGGYVL